MQASDTETENHCPFCQTYCMAMNLIHWTPQRQHFFLSQSNSFIPIKHNHTKPNTNSIFWTAWTSWIRTKSYSQYIQFPRKTICKETPLPSTGAWHNSRPPNSTSCGPGVLSRGHWPVSSRIFGYSKCWFSRKLLVQWFLMATCCIC